jgi:hypothetical protein
LITALACLQLTKPPRPLSILTPLQTRATLDFAARAARIMCRPESNVVPLEAPSTGDVTMAQVSKMKDELELLRGALAERTTELEALRAQLGPGGGAVDRGGRGINTASGCSVAVTATAGGDDTRKTACGGSSALERLLRRASDAREARLRRSGGGWARAPMRGCVVQEGSRSSPGCAEAAAITGQATNSGCSARRGSNEGAEAGAGDISAAADQLRKQGPDSSSSPGSLIWRILQFNRHTSSGGGVTPSARARVPSLGGTRGLGRSGADGGSASPRESVGASSSGNASGSLGLNKLRRHWSLDVANLPGAACFGDAAQCGEGGPRRASDGGPRVGDCAWSGGRAFLEAAVPSQQAVGQAALRQHMIEQLLVLLQERKAEVRQLRQRVDQQAHRLAQLTAQLEAARAEVEKRDARLEAMVEGVGRLGASRQAEMARVAAALARVESGLVGAQREAAAYQSEAAALRDQLTATRNLLLATGQALAEAKVGGTVGAGRGIALRGCLLT